MTRSEHPVCDWPDEHLAEARAVIADITHHGDPLIRLACNVLAYHGETATEREEARRLLVIIDARRPIRTPQRQDDSQDERAKPDGRRAEQ